MVDGDGAVPDGLLDELAAVADEHAAEEAPEPRPRRQRTRGGEEV
jgi:hypothetical protein